MTPWTCRAARRALESYHDAELPMEARASLQSHLRRCDSCRRERTRLRDLTEALRSAAAERPVGDPDALGRRVLARLNAERRPPLVARVQAMFVDMRLVWPVAGALVATIACSAAGIGLMRLTLREQPASMAALIGALADPGSNQNPVPPDDRMLLPRTLPDLLDRPVVDREDSVVAIAAVVTREGRVRNLELLLDDGGRTPVATEALGELLDAAALTRFEPARAGGSPVAVNMVWLLAQTRVRGGADPVIVRVPAPRARPVVRTGARPAPVAVPPIAAA